MPDRHRDEVAARLRSRGIDVRTEVGLSGFALDLVLGDSRVAVLLDGALGNGIRVLKRAMHADEDES